MAILIGGRNPLGNANITSRERITLNSVTQSNLILLHTSLPSANIEFDYKLVFGRSNDYFYFNQYNSNQFIIAQNNAILYPPTYIQNNLYVSKDATFTSNVFINRNVIVPNVFASNIQVNLPILKSAPPIKYLTSYDNLNNQLLSFSSDGAVGIGGTATIDNCTVRYNLISATLNSDIWYSSAWVGNDSIRKEDQNYLKIQFSRADNLIYLYGSTQLLGKLRVVGDLEVTGTYQLNIVDAQYIRARSNLVSTQIELSNLPYPIGTTLGIKHNSLYTNSNIIDVSINNSNSTNFNAMTMNSQGILTLGPNISTPTKITQGLFNINYNRGYSISNLLSISSLSNTLLIDNNVNIAIGITSNISHRLHINKTSNHDINPIIGLYTQSNNSPFMICRSNTIPLYHINSNGSLTIGNITPNPNWNINVASNIRSPILQTSKIIGYTDNCNISLDFTSLSNVNNIQGNSLTMSQLSTVSTLITDYFEANNFRINGLDISSANGIFNVYQPISWFSSSNLCLSFDGNDIQTPQNRLTDGRLKIITDIPSNLSDTSVGLHVKGVTDNSIRIASQSSSKYELNKLDIDNTTKLIETSIGVDANDTFNIIYKNNRPGNQQLITPFRITNNGIFFQNSIQIDNNGRMGIKTFSVYTNPRAIDYNLEVAGSALFETRSTINPLPILYIDDISRSVGIGTTTNLLAPLHVQGDSYVSATSYMNNIQTSGTLTIRNESQLVANGIATFNSNVNLNGAVGIKNNSPNPSYSLDIIGDLNVSGRIYQGNRENIPNPYGSTDNGVNILSNVGIGLLTPLAQLHVKGNNRITSPDFNIPRHDLQQIEVLTNYENYINIDGNSQNQFSYTITASSMSGILNAFDGNRVGTSSWRSTSGYTSSINNSIDGRWAGSTSNDIYPPSELSTYSTVTLVDNQNVYGHWIQVKTSEPICFDTINISVPARGTGSQNVSSPFSLQIVGSFDGINWTLLKIPDDNINTNFTQGISWPLTQLQGGRNIYYPFNINKNRTAFNYIRVIFDRIYGGRGTPEFDYVEINDILFLIKPANVYFNNGSLLIGPYTSNARQSIDIQGGSIIVNNGNIGIGTLYPTQPLHVIGKSLLYGNVGISNLTPAFSLDVAGDINFTGAIYQNNQNYIPSPWYLSNENAPVRGTDIYIMSNVGIGTAAPLSNLHVQGTTYLYGNAKCESNLLINGTLFTRGNIATLSDKTIKTDLISIINPIEKILKLNGYIYRRIDTDTIETGLLAQDVQSVMPQLVTKNDNDLLTIAYGNMAGLFVEAIKTLNNRISILEKDISDLKDKI